jgi:hypothetical protein
MIDPEHDLSIQKQAEVLDISRSSVYYQPRPVSESDLWLMRLIDQLHLDYPFAGSRMLRDLLWQQGLEVGRRHVRTLMRRMAIGPSIADRTRPNPRQDTRSTRTCCVAWPSRALTRCGRWTSVRHDGEEETMS